MPIKHITLHGTPELLTTPLRTVFFPGSYYPQDTKLTEAPMRAIVFMPPHSRSSYLPHLISSCFFGNKIALCIKYASRG